MSNTVLTNTSNLLNNIGVILQINAVTFGINANDIAPNKLISKFPVYFMINNTTEVKIETIKNAVKINFLMTLYFLIIYILNICLKILQAYRNSKRAAALKILSMAAIYCKNYDMNDPCTISILL